MPRPIWSGVISFGMVSIPVKLYTATESKDITFHLLHRECNSRLRQQRWCPQCQQEVPWGEVARGYEYAKDDYITLTDEDFEKLPLPSKHTIELLAFVNSQEVAPVFYEKSYYLQPDTIGVRPMALLMRILKEKGMVAVGKVAIRNKERLCALQPQDGTMLMETLFYPDEIRLEKDTQAPEVTVSEGEMTMAHTLIDLLSAPFEPEKFHDRYRESLMEIINAKLQGKELAEATAEPATKVIDLMAALRASIEAARKKKQAEGLGGGLKTHREDAVA